VKDTWYVHRMPCNKISSAACWCRSHSKMARVEDGRLGTDMRSLVQFVMKHFEHPRMEYSKFPSDIAWACPRLSFHSRSYGIFTGWCPYSPWATCIHQCRRCYTSCPAETLLQCVDDDQGNAGVFSCSSTNGTVSRHRGWRACRSVRRAVLHDHAITAEPRCALPWLHLTTHFLYRVTITLLRSVDPIWRWRVPRKLSVSGHVFCNMFVLFLKKESHYESLCTIFVSLWINIGMFLQLRPQCPRGLRRRPW
jgi:hypothetical protein